MTKPMCPVCYNGLLGNDSDDDDDHHTTNNNSSNNQHSQLDFDPNEGTGKLKTITQGLIGASYPCGHCYHVACWEEYIESYRDVQTMVRCPMCQEQSNGFCRLYLDVTSFHDNKSCGSYHHSTDIDEDDDDVSVTTDPNDGKSSTEMIQYANSKKAIHYKCRAKRLEHDLMQLQAQSDIQMKEICRIDENRTALNATVKELTVQLDAALINAERREMEINTSKTQLIRSIRDQARESVKNELTNLQRQQLALTRELTQKDATIKQLQINLMAQTQKDLTAQRKMSETIYKLQHEIGKRDSEIHRLKSLAK